MIPGRYRSVLAAVGAGLMYALHAGPLTAGTGTAEPTKIAAADATKIATANPTKIATADATKVLVKDFMFRPMSLTVKAGSTVTWTNMDDEPHTVVSSTGLFRSAALDTNDTFSFKFDKPGTYQFVCTLHPSMGGTIVVQ